MEDRSTVVKNVFPLRYSREGYLITPDRYSLGRVAPSRVAMGTIVVDDRLMRDEPVLVAPGIPPTAQRIRMAFHTDVNYAPEPHHR